MQTLEEIMLKSFKFYLEKQYMVFKGAVPMYVSEQGNPIYINSES